MLGEKLRRPIKELRALECVIVYGFFRISEAYVAAVLEKRT